MLNKMLKIQNFTIRELPSAKTLLVVVLSKYEQIRSNTKCALPIPDDKPGIETLTQPGPGQLSRKCGMNSNTRLFSVNLGAL